MSDKTYRRVLVVTFLVGLSLVYRHVSAKAAIPVPLRGSAGGRPGVEAPHISLKLDPKKVIAGEYFTLSGKLVGYDLGESDLLCLKPTWVIFSSEENGDLKQTPIPDDTQCYEHDFQLKKRIMSPGTFAIGLILRTTGTKSRVQDWNKIYIVVGAKE